MNALDFPSVRIPQAGDVILGRGKSWIVERTEEAESVQTLHLVSCEDNSQGGNTVCVRNRTANASA